MTEIEDYVNALTVRLAEKLEIPLDLLTEGTVPSWVVETYIRAAVEAIVEDREFE